MKRFSKYLLAMLLPLTVLLVRPLTPAAVLAFGQEIRLSTEPVDPRDIFRGDYVTLRFSIEEPDESLLSERDKETISERLHYSNNDFDAPSIFLYVSLAPDGEGIWQPAGIFLTPPEAGVYLQAQAYREYHSEDIELDYGNYLKRYYVRENTGRELEDAARRGELVGLVKVWRGRAVLTSVEAKNTITGEK